MTMITLWADVPSTMVPGQATETCQATLTTEHAASSYGLPVVVARITVPTAAPIRGDVILAERTYRVERVALGPAEVQRLYVVGTPAEHERPMIEAARVAGYRVDIEPEATR